MHTSENSEYMLLLTGYEWDQGLTSVAARQALDSMFAWFANLQAEGIATGGRPLARMGKIVSGSKGRVVADGPFAEAKEVVGGYLTVQAADLAEATSIAQGCPLLEHGLTIDVRAIVDECSISQRLREEAELATA